MRASDLAKKQWAEEGGGGVTDAAKTDSYLTKTGQSNRRKSNFQENEARLELLSLRQTEQQGEAFRAAL